MYLKSIEVHGFKSFANRIVFEFHDGITAIVGPNGSGKSNVADAVRWVLGEQKVSQLRSSSMQDVIFAGTETRKPLSYAYVAITLDNSDRRLAVDYSEVTVARRVYRSGESEYLLNGSPCRLRDINELFYDTGIGKEGYSIIGQGQIDRILSGKPEDRRELFDEAAGIVKYKKRKQAAERKLEDERQNLVRVDDIIAELEKQLAPLEKQSEKAKKYLNLRDRLKACEVNRFLLESAETRARLDETEKNLAIAEEEQQEVQQQLEEIRGSYSRTEQEIAETEKKISDLLEEQHQAGVEKEKNEGRLKVLEEQIRTAQVDSGHRSHRLEIIADDRKRYKDERTGYEEKKRGFADEVRAAAEKKERQYREMAQIRSRIEDCEAKIADCSDETIDLLKQKADRQGEERGLEAQLGQVREQREELDRKSADRESAGGELRADLEKAEAECSRLEGRLSDLAAEEKKIGGKLDGWKEKSEAARAQLEEARENYHRDSSRLESLRNIAERYDGYGVSIRRVMEQKGKIPGIHGVVADILKVEKKYETAVETALGGSIQNIVTEDEATAKELIAFLKKNRYGRATFLPLNSVHKKSGMREDVLSEPGVIGYADSLVSTEPRYRGIAGYLLGRTLAAEDIDCGIALQRKYHYSLRIVTLEGELLQPGGSMTGGAFKNSSNLLGRSREIAQLAERVKKEDAQIEKLSSRLEEISTARALLKEDLAEVRKSSEKARLDRNTARLNLDRGREKEKEQEAFFESVRRDREELAGREKEIEEELEKYRFEAEKAAEREEELERISDEEQEKLDCENEAYRREQNRQSEILMEEAAIRQKNDFLEENIRRIDGELEKLDAEEKEILEASGKSEEEIAGKRREIEEIRASVADSEERQRGTDEALAKLQKEKEKMSASHQEYFSRREEISDRGSQLDKEVFRLKDRKEKLEEQSEKQISFLWDEYELTPHAAEALRDPECGSLSELKKQSGELRGEIRGLGNVNVSAIEEYKSVSERHAFMDGQRQDLVDSEEELMKIIADLEDGMRTQFNEKFAQIQVEFDKAFKELFGGGKGTLELMEGEDVLESGVRIIAQPPGKKLQNMMQLSGGEKALTAIALLFAIQNMKPSPFCLLDEIEAALDDSNVTRFAQYLRKLSKNTQFILITHRRGTMLAADRLYGITMQEKGVSALVSVDLIEKQLDD